MRKHGMLLRGWEGGSISRFTKNAKKLAISHFTAFHESEKYPFPLSSQCCEEISRKRTGKRTVGWEGGREREADHNHYNRRFGLVYGHDTSL